MRKLHLMFEMDIKSSQTMNLTFHKIDLIRNIRINLLYVSTVLHNTCIS